VSRTFISAGLRRLVHKRAAGRCEYCGISETFSFAPHQIDHIVAEKHGGETNLDNLALCCTLCNRHKGSDLTAIDPQTGNIVLLFDPRREAWDTHFRLTLEGHIWSDTPEGRATIRLLQFNRLERIEERRLLMLSIQPLGA
jgi:5-methylcytosine-specific restriction endonuclease McrA